MSFISDLPETLAADFSSDSSFSDCDFTAEYPGTLMSKPLIKATVVFGVESASLAASGGAMTGEIVVSVTAYAPRSAGGTLTRSALDRVVTALCADPAYGVSAVRLTRTSYSRTADSVRQTALLYTAGAV